MTTNHTPGSWMLAPTFYEDGKGFRTHTGYYIRSESREAICRVDGMDEAATADANLIAAAPALLAACEAAYAYMGGDENAPGYQDFAEAQETIRAALSLARGGAS